MGAFRLLLAVLVAVSHMGKMFMGFNPGVVAVISFPTLVTGGIEKVESLSADQIMEQLDAPKAEEAADPLAGMDTGAKDAPAAPAADGQVASAVGRAGVRAGCVCGSIAPLCLHHP